MSTVIKKRFIAGAKCPACAAADRVMLIMSADDEWIECIECGHIERRPTEVVTKDPDHAPATHTPATTDVVGVVQFRSLR